PRHAGFRAARRRLRFPRGDTGSSLLAAPWCGGLLRRRDPLPWTSTGLAAREAKHRVTPRVLSRARGRALAAPTPRRPLCWWPVAPGGVGPGARLVRDPLARATLGFVPMLVGAVLRDAAPLVRDVVHENVLTKMLRLDVKGAAIVDLRHLVHEVHQIVSAREHERVDGDALARAAHDLAKRLLEGLLRRRIREARA